MTGNDGGPVEHGTDLQLRAAYPSAFVTSVPRMSRGNHTGERTLAEACAQAEGKVGMDHDRGAPNKAEREFETMADEFYKTGSMAWFANVKRTYDEFQDLSVRTARDVHNLTLQVMQNAIAAAKRQVNNGIFVDHLANLQAIAHRDVAIDSTWVPGPGEEGIEMPGDKDE